MAQCSNCAAEVGCACNLKDNLCAHCYNKKTNK